MATQDGKEAQALNAQDIQADVAQGSQVSKNFYQNSLSEIQEQKNEDTNDKGISPASQFAASLSQDQRKGTHMGSNEEINSGGEVTSGSIYKRQSDKG